MLAERRLGSDLGRAMLAAAVVWLLGVVRGSPAAQGQPQDGLWPTPRMIHLMVERIIEDRALRLGFDERQRRLFRQRFERILPTFLEKYRGTLEPVITDVILQHITGEVPTTQKVAGWGKKLLPVLREAMDEWEGVYQDMRPHLSPEQRRRWGQEHFMLKLGYALAEAKLRSFARGRFDPREWHTPFPGPHQERQKVLAQARQAGLETRPPPDLLRGIIGGMGPQRPAAARPFGAKSPGRRAGPRADRLDRGYLPLDEWERYAKRFIERFQLDEGQQTSAMATLKEMRQRAAAYRRRHSEDLARLGGALRKAKGDARVRLKAELAELERPLGELFEEFRSRLDRLLTRSQRQLRAPNP